MSIAFWWRKLGAASWARPSTQPSGVRGNDKCWTCLYSMQGMSLTHVMIAARAGFWKTGMYNTRSMTNRMRVIWQGGSDRSCWRKQCRCTCRPDGPLEQTLPLRSMLRFLPRFHWPVLHMDIRPFNSWFKLRTNRPLSTPFRMIHNGFVSRSHGFLQWASRALVWLNGIVQSLFVCRCSMIPKVLQWNGTTMSWPLE